MTISLVFDFDGTLATSFVGGLMFRGYVAEDELVKARVRYETDETSLREYQEEVFDHVTETPEQMSRRARKHASIRPYAREVVEEVRNQSGTVAVASAGLDFYIEPVLDNSGLDQIEIHSGKVVYDSTKLPPFGYDYPSAGTACKGDWVTCKCDVINSLKSERADSEVIFVGDGTGADQCAATNAADTVFASGRLLSFCASNGISAIEFGDDFKPLLNYVVSKTSATGAK